MSIDGCAPKSPSPIESSYTPPVLGSLFISASVIDTDSILVGSERLPDDVLEIMIIASVDLAGTSSHATLLADIRSADGTLVSSTSSFNDVGTAPDITSNDGRHTGEVTFSVVRSRIGSYTLFVTAKGADELLSTTLSSSFRLIRSNLPPSISNLEADSVVSLSGGNTTLQLRIMATDPNGREDIQRVWFDSFRPDGTPSSGNPFFLFDDGNTGGVSGDAVAQDGTYGLQIVLQGAALGTYRFSFKASDRSRDTSNVIDHIISVVP